LIQLFQNSFKKIGLRLLQNGCRSWRF